MKPRPGASRRCGCSVTVRRHAGCGELVHAIVALQSGAVFALPEPHSMNSLRTIVRRLGLIRQEFRNCSCPSFVAMGADLSPSFLARSALTTLMRLVGFAAAEPVVAQRRPEVVDELRGWRSAVAFREVLRRT